jgi:hypothetical protein
VIINNYKKYLSIIDKTRYAKKKRPF